jgi:hypothetical protein
VREHVIVLGAGASYEVGLPVGSDLKQKISNLLRLQQSTFVTQISNTLVRDAIHLIVASARDRGTELNSLMNAATQIAVAMPLAESIDNFINNRKGDASIEQVSKLCIASAILDAEFHSKLAVADGSTPRTINFAQLEQTWYPQFYKRLTENCTFADLPERLAKVSIISFNYDRCIEHFLHHAIRHSYTADHEQAASVLKNLEIIHPYGSVGHLEWQEQTGATQFGMRVTGQGLLSIAKQIMTFSESLESKTSEVETIRERVREAKKVVFLGFGFHPLNMDLLRPRARPSQSSPAPFVFCTGAGCSPNDVIPLRHEIGSLFGRSYEAVELEFGKTCFQLYGDHWRRLRMT